MLDDAEIARRFPRAAKYPQSWLIDLSMGPSVLWLVESLSQAMTLRPGMRVLDLGCGQAVSSMFLAREFDVQVWAADLWIKPTVNFERIRAEGLDRSVFPLHTEAHRLPFADGFFDAIISIDAYHYFGTDALYLPYLARFLRPGGEIGIVVPGLAHEFAEVPPEHLQPYWDLDFWSFHSAEWWRQHWERTGLIRCSSAEALADGGALWLTWLEKADAAGKQMPKRLRDATWSEREMLRTDGGRTLGFTRMVATKL